MGCSLCDSTHHRGPLIIMSVGIGFGLVGAIPVAVNSALGETNSGTIIGVGFIGFGLLLIIPGLIWCVVQRLVGLRRFCYVCCRSEATRDLQDTTPALKARLSRTSTADVPPSVHHPHYQPDEEDDDQNYAEVFISIPDPPQRTESSR